MSSNCTIKKLKNKTKITWKNGSVIYLEGKSEYTYILPHIEKGFYYLKDNNILHYIDENTIKLVLKDKKVDHNFFGTFEESDIIFFEKYNVIMIANDGGDRDYYWWYDLNKYDQDINLGVPNYYNGIFNDSVYMRKINDRYAVLTHTTDSGDSDDDNDDNDDNDENDDNDDNDDYDDSDYDDNNDNNKDIFTIIFDAKTMKKETLTEQCLRQITDNINNDIEIEELQQLYIDKLNTSI